MKKIIFILIFILALSAFCHPLNAQTQPNFILDWSTDTYIPPEYPGKALPINGSLIKVNAVPTAKSATDINSLRYKWYLDDVLVSAASGKGKTTFSFRARKTEGSTYRVKLNILDANGNQLSQKNTSIKIVGPEIGLAYSQVSDEQIQNSLTPSEEAQSLSVDFDKIESELKYSPINPAEILSLYYYSSQPQQDIYFSAIPYFFNIKNISGLNFSWQFNNQPIASADSKKPNLLRLVVNEYTEESRQTLSISINNKNNSSEKKSVDLNILFTFSD